MKYTGYIIGLLPISKSLYNGMIEEENCYLWKAKIFAEFIDDNLIIKFNWDQEPYDLMLKKLKENYYTGDIIKNYKKIGDCFLWKYNL